MMYSAANKLYHAFMHTVAVALFFALLGTLAITPVEIAAKLGARWASRIVIYFAEGGRQ